MLLDMTSVQLPVADRTRLRSAGFVKCFPLGKPLDRFAAWLCQPALAHPPHTVVWLWGSHTPSLIFASRACLLVTQELLVSMG